MQNRIKQEEEECRLKCKPEYEDCRLPSGKKKKKKKAV